MVADKLGLNAYDPVADKELHTELLILLQTVETDMTIFYRKLGMLVMDAELGN
jgi:hypothetical protein